jgi:hypothetical protein
MCFCAKISTKETGFNFIVVTEEVCDEGKTVTDNLIIIIIQTPASMLMLH